MSPVPPPECTRLAAELRAARDRAGLSLAALAEKSAYSKSTWHRYLSGAALPPWPAVRDLGRLAGVSEERLRALWELADAAYSRRDAVRPAAEEAGVSADAGLGAVGVGSGATNAQAGSSVDASSAGSSTGRRSRRPRRMGHVLAVSTAVAALVAVVAYRWTQQHTTASASPFHVACSGTACDGRDPQDTGCGVSPETLLTQQVTKDGASVQIRYSPDCRAVWARIWDTQLGDVVTLDVPQDSSQRASVADVYSQKHFVYTPLAGVKGTNAVVTACLASQKPGQSRCFSAVVP